VNDRRGRSQARSRRTCGWLTHPEPGFYAVGVKSYGRVADTGLATGVEGALLTIPLVEVSTGGCCG